MRGRRMQLVFLALVAVLLVGRALMGSPTPLTIQEVWQQITR